MKVLYVSNADARGGAARGAYRLHHGFMANGIRSELVVKKKYTKDETVVRPRDTALQRFVGFLGPYVARRLLNLQKSPNQFPHSVNLFPGGLLSTVNASNADIVILHWIGGETMSIREIGRINKPIIWRLADQWAFSGAEHYTLPCQQDRVIKGYSRKNRPVDHKGADIDRWVWKRKKKHWLRKPMTIVTASHWLANEAKNSFLFRRKRVEVIPSGLDTNLYKPLDKEAARKALNLPLDRRLILFGSLSATSDQRKGYRLLIDSLKLLQETGNQKVAAVIFGASAPQQVPDLGMPQYYLGTLYDDWSLALTYSAVDLFVLPTMHDNLPYTVIEAMACGTPCVSFEVGGLPEMIDHKTLGYLAKPFDCGDLAEGIKLILENDQLRYEMSIRSRTKALREYDVGVQVDRYSDLLAQVKS